MNDERPTSILVFFAVAPEVAAATEGGLIFC
jgi:hypothetical protein